MKSLIVFGGSFDPVHKGHIDLAQAALRSVSAEKLYFVPTGMHPFKKQNTKTCSASIVNMLKLSIENIESSDKYEIEPYELENFETVSYTYNTIRYIKAKHPEFRIYLLIGADNLKDFKKWHKWEGILENAELIAGLRKSVAVPDFRLYDFNFEIVDADAPNISSSQLKSFISEGDFDSAGEFLYPNVLEYIKSKNLYDS